MTEKIIFLKKPIDRITLFFQKKKCIYFPSIYFLPQTIGYIKIVHKQKHFYNFKKFLSSFICV